MSRQPVCFLVFPAMLYFIVAILVCSQISIFNYFGEYDVIIKNHKEKAKKIQKLLDSKLFPLPPIIISVLCPKWAAEGLNSTTAAIMCI